MTEFRHQDLSGAVFQRVSLENVTFDDVELTGATMHDADLSGLQIRGASYHGGRMRGVVLRDLEISGEVSNVTVNGVDIAPLVDAELDRRMPERVKMRPTTPDGYREAWTTLERLWEVTVDEARSLPPQRLHRSVDDEWSFIQTLRHLCFATDAWVGRMILGNPSPWHPLDLPWDEAPGWDGIPWDREVRPDLDDVLAVRRERQAMVRSVVDDLTAEQLASTVSCTAPGWPRLEEAPFADCLSTVLVEEWEHRLYAERDLAVLRESVDDGADDAGDA